MTDKDGLATQALNIIDGWSWSWRDPDGAQHAFGVPITQAVNRLAMDGIPRPHDLVLHLLCNEKLIASGKFIWRKYEHGTTYSIDEYDVSIKPRHWQTLRSVIDDENAQLANGNWPLGMVDLEKLGFADCSTKRWDFQTDAMSYAVCPPDIGVYDQGYFEEYFSGYELEIRPVTQVPVGSISLDEPSTDFIRTCPSCREVSKLPHDEVIKAKMMELVGYGMRRDEAAKFIRQLVGFEQVGNEHARRVVAGELLKGRKPRQK